MKLSVIIPCFNAAEFLAVQLEALATQQWSETWEVIIADNGSTDRSRAIAEQYIGHIPNLRIVDASTRRGAAHARNVGAASAQGEVLAFCDVDDEVAPGWVAAMGEALSDHEFVVGRIQYQKLNPSETVKNHQPWTNGVSNAKIPPYLPHGATCNLGVHRALHEHLGGFDENLMQFEDMDYCWRIHLANIQPYYAADAIVEYRLRQSLASRCRQSRLSGQYSILIYQKYRHLVASPISWVEDVRGLLTLLKRLPQIRRQKPRAGWMREFAWYLGRWQGWLRYWLSTA